MLVRDRDPMGLLPLGQRVFAAYLWALAFAFSELLAVALLRRTEFAGGLEVLLALTTLGPPAAVALFPFALVAGGLAQSLIRSEERLGRRVFAGGMGLVALLTALSVSTGRHFTLPLRLVFAGVIAFVVVLGAWFAGRAFASYVRRQTERRRQLVVVAASVGTALLLEIANAKVLPRSYPGFHHALSFLTVLAAALMSLRSGTEARRPWLRPAAALSIFALCAAFLPSAARRASLADNVRFIVVEHAPVLSGAVRFAAALEPPPPIGSDEPMGQKDAKGSLDLRGETVLLISVDALRPDHLQPYGYARETSPEIQKLATEGVTFEAAYTATPHTSYAIGSLMTGKYMRPLLAMGLGEQSETMADHARRYGIKTAAFYPPAVFFIDAERFSGLSERSLGFEYQRVEFLPAQDRAAQVARFLDEEAGQGPALLWVHLFEPHEPYERHSEKSFGDRDIDRYDAEIWKADQAVGSIVKTVRDRRPGALVILTADHGEEFGEHGGRYHGTTVYEEQVRVPLIVSAPGKVLSGRRVTAPVSLVDLLSTYLAANQVPRPARIRGRDLGGYLTGEAATDDPGFGFAETDQMVMFAEGRERLVCHRKASACRLYDLAVDPLQTRDIAAERPEKFRELREKLRQFDASHGRFERDANQLSGAQLPDALRRGLSGDPEAALEVASLLEDAEVEVRRKAAEVLFDLERRETAPALRLALGRETDPRAKAMAALALTRLGEGAPLVFELLDGNDLELARLAALALGEGADRRGEALLLRWWAAAYPAKSDVVREPLDFERAKEILAVIGPGKNEDAVGLLLPALGDVRLRPHVAKALAELGYDAARPALARRLLEERFEPTQVALLDALLALGGGPELVRPLVSLLGLPDPLTGALGYAEKSKQLRFVGGPTRDAELGRLRRFANSGVMVDFVVPALVPGSTEPQTPGVRAVCRAQASGPGGEIRLGRRGNTPRGPEKKAPVPAELPAMDLERAVTLPVAESTQPIEVFATLPAELGAEPGKGLSLVIFANQAVTVTSCALVPLRGPIPPEAARPWKD